MPSFIWIQQEVVAEEMSWTAAKCSPVAEGEGLFLRRAAGHLGPDSLLHTCTACRHCHTASELPNRLHRDTLPTAGWPIACKPRHRIGILQRASLGPAIPSHSDLPELSHKRSTPRRLRVAKSFVLRPFWPLPLYWLGGVTFGTTGIQPPGQLLTYG
jgi:hypothetical protein